MFNEQFNSKDFRLDNGNLYYCGKKIADSSLKPKVDTGKEQLYVVALEGQSNYPWIVMTNITGAPFISRCSKVHVEEENGYVEFVTMDGCKVTFSF